MYLLLQHLPNYSTLSWKLGSTPERMGGKQTLLRGTSNSFFIFSSKFCGVFNVEPCVHYHPCIDRHRKGSPSFFLKKDIFKIQMSKRKRREEQTSEVKSIGGEDVWERAEILFEASRIHHLLSLEWPSQHKNTKRHRGWEGGRSRETE